MISMLGSAPSIPASFNPVKSAIPVIENIMKNATKISFMLASGLSRYPDRFYIP
jgi:hypothetical protein